MAVTPGHVDLPKSRRLLTCVESYVSRLVVGVALRRRLELIAERKRRHAAITDADSIALWQTEAFNRVWRRASKRFRFYAEWKRRHALPDQIKHISDLARFPILRSRDIDFNLGQIAEDAAPCGFVYTGGSTGYYRPFPRGSEDHALIYSSLYLGRSWGGIAPADNIVLIWGHEHLFGSGAMGHVRRAVREVQDWLVGTHRLNVYRLDEETVASYFAAICQRPGAVLVGYTSAIRKLLDFIEQSGADGGRAQVRAVIFCAETTTQRDLERVRRLLCGVPLIEYGMQEVGVMAYSSRDSSALTFFWDAVNCHVTATNELVVTSLQDVRFPVINYGTEDQVEPIADGPSLPFRCARISGRKRDILRLSVRGGRSSEVHSELLADILDVIPEVRAYCLQQNNETVDIAVQLRAGYELGEIRNRFLQEMRREIVDLDESKITMSALDRERQTIAGKRQIMRHDVG